MLVQGVELVHHSLGIGVNALVELHCVPAVLAPVLPVLHQGVDRKLAFAELRPYVENLLLGVIALTALPVSVYPLGKQGRRPCELAVIGNDTIQLGSVEKIVVDGLPHFGAKSRRILWWTRRQLNSARTTLCRNLILLVWLQVHDAGPRTRSPHVDQINHVLAVHIYQQLIPIVASEQKAITARCSGGEFSLARVPVNSDRLVGRIEVS